MESERNAAEIFAILVKDHELGLLAYVAANVHDHAAVADIVQDTLVRAWERLNVYDSTKPFAAWIRGIAKHKIIDYYRTQQRASRHLSRIETDAGADSDESEAFFPDDDEGLARSLTILRDCLSLLPHENRRLVEMHYVDQHTAASIAGQLGLHAETVKKRLQRTRASLAECIRKKLSKATSHAER